MAGATAPSSNRASSSNKRWRFITTIGLALVAAAGVVSAVSAPAAADDRDNQLTQRQSELSGQINQAQTHVEGQAAVLYQAQAVLAAAQARVADAQSQVAQAQAAVAAAQAAVDLAKAHDAQMAAELAQAEAELASAQTRESEGEAAVAHERDRLAGITALNFQQGNSLITVATALDFDSGSTDLANRIQWAETTVTSSQAALDRLEDIQRQLISARADTEVAQARADDAKLAAEEQVRQTEAAQAVAEAAEAALQSALAVQQAAQAEAAGAQAAAEQALASAQQQLASFQAEQDSVNAEIAQRAEAARQAAAAAAAAANAASYVNPGPVAASSGLVNPVSGAWISSSYGYRYNPIGGYSELHDGTDFAANCWTPIRSIANGTVIRSFYDGGYGYRVFVDHGYVGGSHMISAYNHMVQPGLPVGSDVSQGTTVGYVGTTGWSTGCHLHFHLYVNGSLVDPMRYL